MNDYSLLEKFKILMNMVSSSSLFLFCFMVGIAILILYIISLKKHQNINRWVFIGAWILILLILVIRYFNLVSSLVDNLFDTIFMALYFPNITVYIVVISVSNILFIYSLINKTVSKFHKIVNFLGALFIDILLVIIADVINVNSLNIQDNLVIYSNQNLLVLLELTMAIFVSWLLINLFISAKIKLKKYDEPVKRVLPEIVFEDI